MESNIKTVVGNKRLYRRLINVGLLPIGLIVSISGLFIQIHYHIQNSSSIGYNTWANIHKWASLLFTILIVFHIILHAKWYNNVIEKHLIKKNKITLYLTAITLVAALLGFAACIATDFDTRHVLIEIHDKTAMLFFVLLLIHVLKKCKWYLSMR